MSYWAELDANNVVIQVTRGNNDDAAGDEGYKWLVENLGGTWVKTSYNGTIRYNYAGIGYTYNADADAFIAPRPECGHTELFLDPQYRWQCQRCELDAQEL